MRGCASRVYEGVRGVRGCAGREGACVSGVRGRKGCKGVRGAGGCVRLGPRRTVDLDVASAAVLRLLELVGDHRRLRAWHVYTLYSTASCLACICLYSTAPSVVPGMYMCLKYSTTQTEPLRSLPRARARTPAGKRAPRARSRAFGAADCTDGNGAHDGRRKLLPAGRVAAGARRRVPGRCTVCDLRAVPTVLRTNQPPPSARLGTSLSRPASLWSGTCMCTCTCVCAK